MKDFQTANDFKQIFDSARITDIDVCPYVMQMIYKKKSEKDTFRRRKVIPSIILSAILLLAVGFTAVQIWDLKGPSNTSYKYQLIDNGDTLPADIVLAGLENLEPGEAVAIMKTTDNPGNAIHIINKPIVFQNIEELSIKVGSRFKSPSFMPQGYVLNEGRLNLCVNHTYATAMIEESRNSDKEYIIKAVEPNDDVSYYDMIYKKNNSTITVSVVFNYPSKSIYAIKNDHKATKINVNSFEAIYVEHDGISEITWLEAEGSSTNYYIIHSNNIYEGIKDDLIQVSESMK